MTESHAGTCFCGAVALESRGAPLEMGYCHCADCRAWSGAPFVGFVLWPADAVRVTRGAELLGTFDKGGMSRRRFCTRCGGHVMVDLAGMGLADVYPSVLPTLAFVPTVHLNYASRVLPMRDGLLKLKDFPAEAGGSGETLPE